MRNQEISKILQEANNNNSYLWDLPRPQWKDIDFYNLNQIKQGNEIKKRKVIDYVAPSENFVNKQKGQEKTMKRIIRKSDGKIFFGVNQCSRETGIHRSNLSNALNKLSTASKKLMMEYEFITNQNN